MFQLTPSDVKLIGFEFMYVWNEFKTEFPSIVDEIEKKTIDQFGELAISKQHIINKCRRIMVDKNIDLKNYNDKIVSKRKRELEKEKEIKESRKSTYDDKYVNALQKEIDNLQTENLELKNKVKCLENENISKDKEIMNLKNLLKTQ